MLSPTWLQRALPSLAGGFATQIKARESLPRTTFINCTYISNIQKNLKCSPTDPLDMLSNRTITAYGILNLTENSIYFLGYAR